MNRFAAALALSGCGMIVGPDAEVNVVGGRKAAPALLPSAVMTDNCTAQKVGPRHFLTAAHCFVYEFGDDWAAYDQVGNPFHYMVGVDKNGRRHFQPTIVRFSMHESWLNYVQTRGRQPFGKDDEAYSDVAVVEVDAEPAGLPVATLGFGVELRPGVSVTLAGFGCQKIPEFDAGMPLEEERFLNFASSSLTRVFKSTVEAEARAGKPMVCPGDSGGALYLNGADGKPTNVIVGLNSSWSARNGVKFSTFARVDDKSLSGVGAWIRERIGGAR